MIKRNLSWLYVILSRKRQEGGQTDMHLFYRGSKRQDKCSVVLE